MVHAISPQFTAGSGAYAMVGMGALVAASTQAPITAILMIFEMTGDYKIILPLMVSCTIGTLFYASLSRESIYLVKLVRRGVRIERGREVNVLKSIPVRKVMIEGVETVPREMSYQDILKLTVRTNISYFPVVDDNGEMTGILSRQDLRKHLTEDEETVAGITAEDLASKDVITAMITDNLDEVFKKFGSKNVEEIPVVDPDNPRVPIGMVRRREAIEAYNNEILQRSQQE